MNHSPKTLGIALAAVAACAVGSCLWVFGGGPGLDSSMGRGSVLLGMLSLAGVAAIWVVQRHVKQLETVKHSLEHISRLSHRDLCHDDLQKLSSDAAAPWRAAMEEFRQMLQGLARRVRDAEDERAAVEVKLRRADLDRRRLRAVLDTFAEPVVILDEFGEISMANAPAEELFQFGAEAAEHRAVRNLIKCEELLHLLDDTQRRRHSTTRTMEVALPDADGNLHTYRAFASSIVDSAAACTEPERHGTVLIFRDVSGRKAADRKHAEFLSAVSHEMKTPLAGIKAYVELLVDGDAEDEATREQFLEVINSQADRMQRLIDNLLNLARIESGVVQVKKKTQSLNELLEEALNVVRPAAEAKQITLVNDLSPMYLSAHIDRDQMLQAAINLLSNAVKYTPPAGTVTLRSRFLDNRVRFEVEDTGVGLDEQDCTRVFEKFYRVAKDQDMAPGTGLGLPLAKTIVNDLHAGNLAVRSAPGKGSTFVVTLAGAVDMKTNAAATTPA